MWFPRILVCEPGRRVVTQLLKVTSPPQWVLQHVTTVEELLARVRTGPAGVHVIDWRSVLPAELVASCTASRPLFPEPSAVLLLDDDQDPGPAWELGATMVLDRSWSRTQLITLVNGWMNRLIHQRGRGVPWH